ncbi:MAG: hypothetical protein AB8G16_17155 [Gammaproteobacteria bacterium]
MMRHVRRVLLSVVLASAVSCTGSSATPSVDIGYTEVLPLFNQRIKTSSVPVADRQRINPETIPLPNSAVLSEVGTTLRVESLTDDVVFKDIVIQSPVDLGEVAISIAPFDAEGITITPRLVTSWFQAGVTTKKISNGGALTYELLLSDDREDLDAGSWGESEQGGWIYNPPDIRLGDVLHTRLNANSPKRLLLRFETHENVAAGTYRTQLLIRRQGQSGTTLSAMPVEIEVTPVALTASLDSRYTLSLFTAFKINPVQERPGAYINTMRLPGNQRERNALLGEYLKDIRQHGFNGITVRDWDSKHLSSTLDMAQELGFRDVILHATTPTKKTRNGPAFPIVNGAVVELYRSRNMDALFYGLDEVGGNKQLTQQLDLNRDIHRQGGKSVNAVFWSDLPNANQTIGNDASRCFDVVAHSLGSHGHADMLRGLPLSKPDSACPAGRTKHVVYWHPHVENPTMNRVLMGFWLWASGFDGVIPHGYYFPSHIEKVLKRSDRQRGRSKVASPYDDWSYWLPGETLRHHNAVYPSTTGPIGTLQWEGILNGYTDLKYVVTLEERLALASTDAASRAEIRALLDEIRTDVLQVRSVYLDDRKSIRFLQKLERWRTEIGRLLRQSAATTAR